MSEVHDKDLMPVVEQAPSRQMLDTRLPPTEWTSQWTRAYGRYNTEIAPRSVPKRFSQVCAISWSIPCDPVHRHTLKEYERQNASLLNRFGC